MSQEDNQNPMPYRAKRHYWPFKPQLAILGESHGLDGLGDRLYRLEILAIIKGMECSDFLCGRGTPEMNSLEISCRQKLAVR